MPLTPGTRLGPYEITAKLGAGGMGEVYRARDTALNRDVAIKVMPDALADDPDRLARFQREAEALAALNHPNIAQVCPSNSPTMTSPAMTEIGMILGTAAYMSPEQARGKTVDRVRRQRAPVGITLDDVGQRHRHVLTVERCSAGQHSPTCRCEPRRSVKHVMPMGS